MLPVPTRAAIAAFVACIAMLAVAFLRVSPELAIIAGGAFVALCAALAFTLPISARLRAHRLEFAWWLSHGDPSALSGSVVPRVPFEVRCFIRWRGNGALPLTGLTPILPGGVELADPEGTPSDAASSSKNRGDLLLRPCSRTEFGFAFVAAAPGRVVLQGVALSVPGPLGLFRTPLYFPNPLPINVLPRTAIRPGRAAGTITGFPVERTGQTIMRRLGGGFELRELREFQPGDPFKSIAWKATAKTGRLMVRELEREIQETAVIILDVSGTMRGGEPGSRKLDLAIDIACAESRQTLDRGDRVGLVTVDGRILDDVTPGEGPGQMIRIYDALLAATEVVDADLTETTDAELPDIVGSYLRRQDGIDLSDGDRWREREMLAHVTRLLGAESDTLLTAHVVAGDPAAAQFRRFCLLRGIPLPYLADTPHHAKGEGLSLALREAGGTRMPRSITVITDLDGIPELDTLSKSLRMVVAHGHSVVFIFPDAVSFTPAPEPGLETDLHRIYGLNERHRVSEARAFLGRLGIPLITSSRGDAPSRVVSRAHTFRRVA
jgi:hypothetical protein